MFYASCRGQVKLILTFMAYVGYNSLLELCFAMDEFAMPPPGSEELDQTLAGFESSTDMDNPSDSPSDTPSPLCIDVDVEPVEVVEVCDLQDPSGVVLSASPAASSATTVSFAITDNGSPGLKDLEDELDGIQEGIEEEEGRERTDKSEGEEKLAPIPVVQYTAFTHEGEDESDKRTNLRSREQEGEEEDQNESTTLTCPSPTPLAPPNTQSSASTPLLSSTLDVPAAMTRQLSQPTELTEFTDPLREYQKNHDESIFKRSQSIQFQEQKQPLWHQFKTTLHGTLLSVSPYIKYSLPYLESETGFKCKMRKYLPERVSQIYTGLQTTFHISFYDFVGTSKALLFSSASEVIEH
jgi:1-phosphatidylinositol-3-phosphate 5-kinase